MLTIFEIFHLCIGTLVYETFKDIGPVNQVIKFTLVSEIHEHDTRHASEGNLYADSVRTTRYGLKGLQYEGKKLWAAIPVHIRESVSKRAFKSGLLIETYLS